MSSEKRNEWLKTLAVGDSVHIPARWDAGLIERVERLTATQIITERGLRFRRDDGYRVGDRYSAHIMPVDDAVRDEIRKGRLVSHLSHLKWRDLPLDRLEAAYAAVTPEGDSK